MESSVLFAIFLILVFGTALVLRKKKIKQDELPQNEEELVIDYNEEFFSRIEGRPAIDVIKTYNPWDAGFLQSLLYDNGIISYLKNGHTSAILPGLMVSGYTDMKISIPQEDINTALPLLKEAIESMKEDRTINAGSTARSVVEYAFGQLPVSTMDNRILPEILLEK